MAVLITDSETFTAYCNGCPAKLVIEIKEEGRWDDQEFTAIADARWESRGGFYYCPDCVEDERWG